MEEGKQTEGGRRERMPEKPSRQRVRRQYWGVVSLLQDQTCSTAAHNGPVIRKSIIAQPEGHLSTEERPKFTVTADEFFGKSCSINTGWRGGRVEQLQQ